MKQKATLTVNVMLKPVRIGMMITYLYMLLSTVSVEAQQKSESASSNQATTSSKSNRTKNKKQADKKQADKKQTDKKQADKKQQKNSKKSAESSNRKAPKILSQEQLNQLIDTQSGPIQKKALWEDFKQNAALYIKSSREHQTLHRSVFQFLYKDQTDRIEKRYKKDITRAEDEESRQRKNSIKRFQTFLNEHKPHPQYTPDSLYRLAMLLLEEEDQKYIRDVEEFNKKIAAGDESDDLFVPQKDHRAVILTFDKLIRNWPKYHDLDSAFYARAHCYLEIGEEEKALKDFQVITKNPRFKKSQYYVEAWNMVGELHFKFAELQKAIYAYKQVIKDPDSVYFMFAYYKLAWTYYRNDQFEDAVAYLKRLVELSDINEQKGKKRFELRQEAIDYLAISLNEDDWDDDGVIDVDAGFKRVIRFVNKDLSFKGELLETVVNIFFENSKYSDAIKTAEYLFQIEPFYKNNPAIHAKIVTAYERIAQPNQAFMTRDRMTDAYVKNGPWYAYNHTDQEAIDQARGLMKDALLQTGLFYLEQANSLRDRSEKIEDVVGQRNLMQKAKYNYAKAAKSYKRYLARYKYDQNTYELWFLYAETLFYSENYQGALSEYIRVRDFKKEKSRQEEAAFSAIASHMELIKKAILSKQLIPRSAFLDDFSDQIPVADNQLEALSTQKEEQEETEATKDQKESKDEQEDEIKKIKPDPIPELVTQAIKLRERYLNLNLSNEEDPQRIPILIYKIGQIYMDYKHFDQARIRFELLIKKHSKSEVALNAARAIIKMYKQEENWKAVSEWAEIIAQSGLGDEAIKEAGSWKVGALFKTAKNLFNKKKYKLAAAEYLKLVEENPKDKDVPFALNNAAVAYEKARMFDSATQMYERIFKSYPNSSFSENALFRVAYNASRFYDYTRAIRTFEALAKRYPKGQYAADAAYNAARLLEQNQFYERSAVASKDYIKRYPDHKRAANLLFSAAKSYAKLGDENNQLKVYRLFNQNYGSDPKHAELFMQGLHDSIEIYSKRGNRKKANKLRKQILKEFEKRDLPKNSLSAKYTAQAAFDLIEPRFQSFKRLEIKGSMRKQGKIIKKMKKEMAALIGEYSNMLRYKSLDWNIAAFYRIGILHQIFAERLYNLPVPASLSEEEKDIYITTIEELALPIEDEAVKRFEVAYKKAREFRLVNEWTRKILLSLNKYKPAEYPTFKQEKRLAVKALLTTSQFVLPVESKELQEKMAEEKTATQEDDTQIEQVELDMNQGDTQSTGNKTSGDSPKANVGKKNPKIPPNSSTSSKKSESSKQSQSKDTQDLEGIEEVESIDLDQE